MDPVADDRTARCRDNVAAVRDRVAEACRRAARAPAAVRIIAVTKYGGPELVRLLHAAGCRDFGESRPQALWAKADAVADLAEAPRWHLIGHLQRNKIRRTLAVPALIHSLDSLRLLRGLETEAETLGVVCEALVEVNLAGGATRTGVGETEAREIVGAAQGMRHVTVRGLMAMAGLPDGDAEAPRREFARLREFRDRLRRECAAPETLGELSMGMSGDYESAILEGATMVRIGSALCAGLLPPGE